VSSQDSRNGSDPTDIEIVRQHCSQCLTEVYADGKQSPTGETLCSSCHSALWGPETSEEFRGMVALHMGRPIPVGVAAKMAR
jgi:hypothetical protein